EVTACLRRSHAGVVAVTSSTTSGSPMIDFSLMSCDMVLPPVVVQMNRWPIKANREIMAFGCGVLWKAARRAASTRIPCRLGRISRMTSAAEVREALDAVADPAAAAHLQRYCKTGP